MKCCYKATPKRFLSGTFGQNLDYPANPRCEPLISEAELYHDIRSEEAMEGSPTLPPEILALIFSYLPPEIHFPSSSQSTLCSAALVCRGWYSSAISELYRAPLVRPSNFDFFVRAVCPSINAHVRHNGLAGFIRRLDLSYLVHNASKSLTARLLGRVKYTLEEFIAPQASFG